MNKKRNCSCVFSFMCIVVNITTGKRHKKIKGFFVNRFTVIRAFVLALFSCFCYSHFGHLFGQTASRKFCANQIYFPGKQFSIDEIFFNCAY